MSSTASTAVATHDDVEKNNDEHIQLERKMTQAADEGHDADIPCSAGYVLSEAADMKRIQSIEQYRRGHSSTAAEEEMDRDVEKGEALGQTKTGNEEGEEDPNIVWWDGEDDPENPYNWSTTRKIINCGCVSFQTFIAPLASCE
jgi:uncharacterized protein YgiB involved in biofilm formation